LSTLSALAEGAEKLFEPHYNDVMGIIFHIFEQSHQPIFKNLVGVSVECISIIAKIFGKEKLIPFKDKLIHEMIRIQTQGVTLDGPDPQKSYLLVGW